MKTISLAFLFLASVCHAQIFRPNCTQVPVPTRADGTRAVSGSLLGAVAGAVIGHQIDSSRRSTVIGAVAGAVVGGVVGGRIEARTTQPFPNVALQQQGSWVPDSRYNSQGYGSNYTSSYGSVYGYNGQQNYGPKAQQSQIVYVAVPAPQAQAPRPIKYPGETGVTVQFYTPENPYGR